MPKKELPKVYEPKLFEDKIYKDWEESGMFNPDNYDLDENSGTFSIMIPPPNITGALHVGHSAFLTYQDTMVRYHRLLGERTVWVPGTDHAGIATQSKVEKIIFEEEGKTRYDIGREELLRRIDQFIETTKTRIKMQIRKMGASCDWSRERYTLDGALNDSVKEVFVRMYRDGLIYRGYRIVNWCPHDQSTLSDDEVEYEDRNAKFYTFKYSADFPIAISTTRPETKLGDTAVAVHPDDERYNKLIGRKYTVNFAGGVQLNIAIIGDSTVDMSFGTGALGVTPAHSHADYEMAQKNSLPLIQVIDQNGLINENGGSLKGLKVLEARKEVVKWLRDNNLLEEEKDIRQNLSICYRCANAIEPLPSKQWFVDVNKKVKFPDNETESLRERMLKVVRAGEIKIIPERFEKTYIHWIENLRDWCISRQIWFGHRLPVWYKGEEVYVGKSGPDGEGWVEETDTLDTWFSSGLWTFSALGWPENVRQDAVAEKYAEKNDFERFHPTSVLETGYDILFFWVARMILMTEYAIGEVPFKTVYLHGLVRDEQGRKMSKSLGNVLDPLDVIEKFGTDALRLSLIIGSTPGSDLKISEAKIENYRNTVNKLYNISRYIFSSVKKIKRVESAPKAKTLADEWILNEFKKTSIEVSDKLNNFHFSAAGERLINFTWDTFADWYIEIAKIEEGKDEILLYMLERLLILWHPFTPFVTEHLWENFKQKEFLMTQRWPRFLPEDIKEVEFDLTQKIISTIRNLRGENKIEPALKLNCLIVSQYDKQIKAQSEIIRRLGRLDELKIVEQIDERPKQSAAGVFGEGNVVYLLLEGIIDVAKETARLEKEIDKTQKELVMLSGKLENEQFVRNAPQEIVEAQKAQFMQAQDRLVKLRGQLESIK